MNNSILKMKYIFGKFNHNYFDIFQHKILRPYIIGQTGLDRDLIKRIINYLVYVNLPEFILNQDLITYNKNRCFDNYTNKICDDAINNAVKNFLRMSKNKISLENKIIKDIYLKSKELEIKINIDSL